MERVCYHVPDIYFRAPTVLVRTPCRRGPFVVRLRVVRSVVLRYCLRTVYMYPYTRMHVYFPLHTIFSIQSHACLQHTLFAQHVHVHIARPVSVQTLYSRSCLITPSPCHIAVKLTATKCKPVVVPAFGLHFVRCRIRMIAACFFSSPMALQPNLGLGLFNPPLPSISVLCRPSPVLEF